MIKRTILELVARYKLDPSLREVFVEGPADCRVLRWAFRSNGSRDAGVFEIELIDVPPALLQGYGLTGGRRQEVQALARELERILGPGAVQPTCIVDADCDRLLGIPLGTAVLLATDYPSMEVYLFHQDDIGKFINLVLGSETADIRAVMRQYGTILQELFLIRAANQQLGLRLRWLDFTKCCNSGAAIEFDREEFISRLLQHSGLGHRKAELLEMIESLRPRVNADVRHQIHGHDFIALLNFANSQRAKKCGLQNEKAVCSALVGCMDVERVLRETLFAALMQRVSPAGVP